jgi:DNA (cytosine-5)-methyltransferase 1
LLDLFCKAGGAGMGYAQAGFDVVGVDIEPQPRYPFAFVRAEALNYLAEHSHEFDAVHASPPCQKYSVLAKRHPDRDYPDLVPPTRDYLHATGLPYVIENVEGAPLLNPVKVCGSQVGLTLLKRHRLFESNVFLMGTPCRHHLWDANDLPANRSGRTTRGKVVVVTGGGFVSVAKWREAMGIDWMTQDELAEAIPPAYTRFIGEQLLRALGAERQAA